MMKEGKRLRKSRGSRKVDPVAVAKSDPILEGKRPKRLRDPTTIYVEILVV